MPIIDFTEAEIVLFRQMTQWYKQHRTVQSVDEDGPAPGDAPEVYIAYIPAGGLPARSGMTPGSVACNIYRITGGTLGQVGTFQETVYNLSLDVIDEGYTLIIRERFGNWMVAPAGAASGTPGSGSVINIGNLTANLSYTDPAAMVNGVEVANPLSLAGQTGDTAVWVYDLTSASGTGSGSQSHGWLINVTHHACP